MRVRRTRPTRVEAFSGLVVSCCGLHHDLSFVRHEPSIRMSPRERTHVQKIDVSRSREHLGSEDFSMTPKRHVFKI